MTIFVALFTFLFLVSRPAVHALGSASTAAATYATATFCGIVAGETTQRIQCYQNGRTIQIEPNVSYQSISGGRDFFCGLRSGGSTVLCWDTVSSTSSFQPKRIYFNKTVALTDLTVGDDQVCATRVDSGAALCWRGVASNGSPFPSPERSQEFLTVTSGRGFTCGVLKRTHRVVCWGNGGNGIGAEIQEQFSNSSMSSLIAGESHACGITVTGNLICGGKNDSGQLGSPSNSFNFEFSGLALGSNFSCAIRQRSGLVTCWGSSEKGSNFNDAVKNISFESVVAGSDFACGLMTQNLSAICWGPRWPNWPNSAINVELGTILPGPCVQGSCGSCGIYPDSETLCNGSGNICKSCPIELPLPAPLPPLASPSQPQSPPPPKPINKLSMAFLVVGSIGAFSGLCSIVYCLWNRKTHEPPETETANTDHCENTGPVTNADFPARSSSTRGSIHADKTQKFSLSELAAATDNFSPENKIGGGSFGVVYKGKLLPDGREVAVKRGDTTSTRNKKLREKESAFESELALLSRVHHKHLVGLVGFCQENDERLLVYDYMANGALHDHLHNKNVNNNVADLAINSWKTRIKIALDAARGIEYLHSYAVPPIIHRDIKSSNILLDGDWTARVSDFGLSLLGPDPDKEYLSTRAVGTIGYIDPEYYVLNVLTTKSDVYSFGVVLLEILTGKRAVFVDEEGGGGPVGVVEYAGPRIVAGKVREVLDKRVGMSEMAEAEAVEVVANTAVWCVELEGKERPSVSDIVANLERAMALCEGSQASISIATMQYE